MVNYLKSQRGEASVIAALIFSTIALTGTVLVLQYTSSNVKSSLDSAAKTVSFAEDLLALDIFSEMINLKGTPEVGAEYYPIPDELNDAKFKPYFVPFKTISNGSLVPNLLSEGNRVGGRCEPKTPEPRTNGSEAANDCDLTHFTGSSSRLSSFEVGADLVGWAADYRNRKQTDIQKGFIAFPSVDKIESGSRESFLRQTTQTQREKALSSKLLKIEKLLGDSSEPLLWAGVQVTMGSTQAVVKVPPPPEPYCQLKATPAPWPRQCVTSPGTSTTTARDITVPRDYLTVVRCTQYPNSLYMPLDPYVDSCPTGYTSKGAVTFSRGQREPIFHVNLGPRGEFNYRGRIYATNLGGEQLTTAESTLSSGTYQITFDQLISEMGVSSTIQSTENVTVQNPPVTTCSTEETPECNGDCIDLRKAREAKIDLYANSILGGPAKISGDNFLNYKSVDVGRQKVADIGNFNLNQSPLGSAVVLPPPNLYQLQGPKIWRDASGRLDDRYGMWIPKARVQGVLRASPNQECSTAVKVYPPPPPACVASVDKTELLPGETANVTLNCQGEISGKVDSAYIVGGNAFPTYNFSDSARNSSNYKIATTTVTRNQNVGPQKVEIVVSGPGGQTALAVYLGAICRFNDPQEIYSGLGRQFRRAPLDYNSGGKSYRTYQWQFPTPQGDFGVVKTCPRDAFCMYNFEKNDQWEHQIWIAIASQISPSCSLIDYAARTVGCFSKETLIRMADGRDKAVTKIQENDLVYNPLFKQAVRVKKVLKGPEKKSMYLVKAGGLKLKVTEDHPFLTDRGWVRADSLKAKDLIMGETLPREVQFIKKLPYEKPEDVYNFELDTDVPEGHIVLANGIPTGDNKIQQSLKRKPILAP